MDSPVSKTPLLIFRGVRVGLSRTFQEIKRHAHGQLRRGRWLNRREVGPGAKPKVGQGAKPETRRDSVWSTATHARDGSSCAKHIHSFLVHLFSSLDLSEGIFSFSSCMPFLVPCSSLAGL